MSEKYDNFSWRVWGAIRKYLPQLLKYTGIVFLAYGGFLVLISHIVFMDAMDENGNEVMMNDKTEADGLLFVVVGLLATGAAILMRKMIHKYIRHD